MSEMDATSGRMKSLWLETEYPPSFKPLSNDESCDVVIVGAGIAGLSVAYNALKKGLSVVVLEDGRIMSGETGRTSAHLASALDDRFYNLEKYFGGKGARLAAQSHASAIDWIERVCQSEKIDCDF